MPAKTNHRNEYQCTIEVNQNGKYCVRVRAMFARKGWVLPVYFLTSTFDRAMRKLEANPAIPAAEGRPPLVLGRRTLRRPEFFRGTGPGGRTAPRPPRRIPAPVVKGRSPEKPVPAVLLAPIRRGLADSIDPGRVSAAGN